MPDEDQLWVDEADRAPPDSARVQASANRLLVIVEINALCSRLERMPTKSYIVRAAFGIIFCSAVVSTFLNCGLLAR